MSKKKLDLSGAAAIIIGLLVLLVFVPVNMIISYYDKVYDMTPSGKYSLDKKTVELLDSVSDKKIEVFFLADYTMEDFQNAPEFLPLYHTLEELEKRDNITVTRFDPVKEPAKAEELNPEGFLATEGGDIFVKCGDVIKRIDHDKIFQTTSAGVAEYAGEGLVASAIKVCTSGTLPTVYFLTGHGEKTIDDSYSTYADQLRASNYAVKSLDLDKEGKIPDNAGIIYIAGITKDITDKELQLLSDYSDKGGSVVVLAAPCDTKGRFDNLETFLEKFELGIDYNIVTETVNYRKLEDRDATQSDYFFRVEYTPHTDDLTQDLTTDINTAVSAGRYIDGIANTRSVYEIPGSAGEDTSFIEKSPIIQSVADYSTGKYTVKSTPMGGDDETRKDAESLNEEEKQSFPLSFGYYSYNIRTMGKVILVGSADIIDTDKVSWDISGTQYLVTYLNTWLCDTDVEVGVPNKSNAYDKMEFDTIDKAESVLRIFFIVPAVVALVGVAVWLKRRYA